LVEAECGGRFEGKAKKESQRPSPTKNFGKKVEKKKGGRKPGFWEMLREEKSSNLGRVRSGFL
jgi:hypothetical protein